MRNVWAAVLILITTCAFSTSGQEILPAHERPQGEKLWKTSLVTLAASSVLDSASSWNKCEANSFLAGSTGRFDQKALWLKGATIGGLVVFEQLTGKKHPKFYRYFSSANFAFSVGLTSVAVHNFTQSAPPTGYSCR